MKKIALLMAFAVLASIFCSCTSSSTKTPSNNDKENPTVEESSKESSVKSPVEIVSSEVISVSESEATVSSESEEAPISSSLPEESSSVEEEPDFAAMRQWVYDNMIPIADFYSTQDFQDEYMNMLKETDDSSYEHLVEVLSKSDGYFGKILCIDPFSENTLSEDEASKIVTDMPLGEVLDLCGTPNYRFANAECYESPQFFYYLENGNLLRITCRLEESTDFVGIGTSLPITTSMTAMYKNHYVEQIDILTFDQLKELKDDYDRLYTEVYRKAPVREDPRSGVFESENYPFPEIFITKYGFPAEYKGNSSEEPDFAAMRQWAYDNMIYISPFYLTKDYVDESLKVSEVYNPEWYNFYINDVTYQAIYISSEIDPFSETLIPLDAVDQLAGMPMGEVIDAYGFPNYRLGNYGFAGKGRGPIVYYYLEDGNMLLIHTIGEAGDFVAYGTSVPPDSQIGIDFINYYVDEVETITFKEFMAQKSDMDERYEQRYNRKPERVENFGLWVNNNLPIPEIFITKYGFSDVYEKT